MLNYSFSVAWSVEDGEYVAITPEFIGLSGLGPTAEDAVRELRRAMEVVVAAYQEDGTPVPEPQVIQAFSGQFRLRLPKSQHAALAARAEREGVSLNHLAGMYIAAGIAGDVAATRASDRFERLVSRAEVALADAIIGAPGSGNDIMSTRAFELPPATLNIAWLDSAPSPMPRRVVRPPT